jgi:hypothetical protein
MLSDFLLNKLLSLMCHLGTNCFGSILFQVSYNFQMLIVSNCSLTKTYFGPNLSGVLTYLPLNLFFLGD